jgi:xanthine dehydrogenase accessory factor
MASATAWRLHQAHLKVVMTEREKPIAVRRQVSFCEAVHDGSAAVEGVIARCISDPTLIFEIHAAGEIPVLIDSNLTCLRILQPDVLVEATLSKRNVGISRELAPLVIAMGPGFTAGRDVDMVIETNRGHNLGRIINEGPAEPNTGIPGNIGGQTAQRVLRAPADGEFLTDLNLGETVTVGQTIATVAGVPVISQIGGVVRGLIRPGSRVRNGLKVGDVDPRGDVSYLNTISEKARAVAGAVLEAIMRVYNR